MSIRSRIAAIGSVALIAALLAGVTLLPRFIAGRLEGALHDAGFSDARLGRVRIAWSGLNIDWISLAPDQLFTIEDIRVGAGFSDLTRMRVREINIGQIKLTLDGRQGKGWHLPGYMPTDTPPLSSLPFDTLHVIKVTAVVMADNGMAKAHFTDLRGDTAEKALKVAARYQLETSAGDIQGAALAAIAIPGFAATGQALIAQGRLKVGGSEANGLKGRLTFRLDQDKAPEGRLDLTARQINMSSFILAPLALKAVLDDGVIITSLSAAGPNEERLAATASANISSRTYIMSGKAEIPRIETMISATPGVKGHAVIDLALSGNGESGNRWGDSLTGAGKISAAVTGLKIPGYLINGSAALSGNIALDPKGFKLTGTGEISGPHGLKASASFANLNARRLDKAWSLDIPRITLAARNFPYRTLKLETAQFRGSAGYKQGDWLIDGPGEARLTGKVGDYDITRLNSRWSGRLSGGPDMIRVSTRKCLDAEAGTIKRGAFEIRDIALPCLTSSGSAPLFEYGRRTGRMTMALRMGAGPLQASYRLNDGPISPMSGTWPTLRMDMRMVKDGVAKLDGAFDSLNLALPKAGLLVQSAKGEIKLSGHSIKKAYFSVKNIKSTASPAQWSPVELTATASGPTRNMTFEGQISDMTGAFVLEAKGSGTPQQGQAAIRLYPVTFIADVQELATFLPAFGRNITSGAGSISFDGALSWRPDKLESGGTLSLKEIGFHAPQADVTDLNGEISFKSLWPLLTKSAQRIDITLLNAGMPLTAGVIRFNIAQPAKVEMTEVRFNGADGALSTEPFTLDLANPTRFQVKVIGVNLKLSKIFELTGIEGLNGEGLLSGRIPLEVSPAGIKIQEGVLDAGITGALTYNPAQLPPFLQGNDMKAQMLREALKDFRYDELSLKLNGLIGDQQTVTLKARGRNPDFLDGHPIELNVNLSGPLANVLRSTLTPYNLPEALEKEFQKKEQENKP